MNCTAIQDLAPLFVEGDLPRRKAERVRRHVEGCPACRTLIEDFRSSQHWLRTSAAPVVDGAALDELRRAVWRQIETQPRPSRTWLGIERAWATLRRWASQPAVAAVAVMVVVVGSVALSRMDGLGGTRLGPSATVASPDGEGQLEMADDPEMAEASDDSERILAQASPDEVAEGEGDGAEGRADEDAVRVEFQTHDPDVRIIWFASSANQPTAAE
jgi:predicted anti-sigma-YlaC factor YlaD